MLKSRAKPAPGKPLCCEVNGQVIACTGTEPLSAGGIAKVIVPVEVATATVGKSVIGEASVEGGGAALAKATTKTAIGLPAWGLLGISMPTNVPGGGIGTLLIRAINVGGAATTGAMSVTGTLPEGLTPTKAASEQGSTVRGGNLLDQRPDLHLHQPQQHPLRRRHLRPGRLQSRPGGKRHASEQSHGRRRRRQPTAELRPGDDQLHGRALLTSSAGKPVSRRR